MRPKLLSTLPPRTHRSLALEALGWECWSLGRANFRKPSLGDRGMDLMASWGPLIFRINLLQLMPLKQGHLYLWQLKANGGLPGAGADLVYLWLGGSHLCLDIRHLTHLGQGFWVSWSLLSCFGMEAEWARPGTRERTGKWGVRDIWSWDLAGLIKFFLVHSAPPLTLLPFPAKPPFSLFIVKNSKHRNRHDSIRSPLPALTVN